MSAHLKFGGSFFKVFALLNLGQLNFFCIRFSPKSPNCCLVVFIQLVLTGTTKSTPPLSSVLQQ